MKGSERTANRVQTRARALAFFCPSCDAKPGEPCLGSRVPPQPRTSVHQARINVSRKFLSPADLDATKGRPDARRALRKVRGQEREERNAQRRYEKYGPSGKAAPVTVKRLGDV